LGSRYTQRRPDTSASSTRSRLHASNFATVSLSNPPHKIVNPRAAELRDSLIVEPGYGQAL
jgi:hypothetical protein